ncbi:MAG TPA: NAD(P)/FAD-dependent oxidoreductase [Tissierellales bacterium]|nr:NAD(P)/FAD-dependent oxidoreductase [Tissierellales bacterium]
MYDVTIIGAGITGTFIARELSRYNLDILLLDKENDVSNGTTKANTALIHAGYDNKPGTKMAYFNVKGNPMFDKVCEELDVPFERIGSLVLGFNDEDMETIEELYERGIKNGVPHMEILNKDQIKDIEPNINPQVIGGLYAKTAGIIGPWELAIALAENAEENGTELLLNTEVLDIKKEDAYYKLITNQGDFHSKYVINCAGLYANKINNLVSKHKITITPKRGQYYLLDKDAKDIVNSILFQCPTKLGKGVVVAPTVHENVIIGPDNEVLENKDSTNTTGERLEYVRQTASKSLEEIPFNKSITNFAGIRADAKDFIIGQAEDAKGFINVAGIKSPGLSSAPAIAEYVVEIIKDISGGLTEKENFNPRRRKVIRFVELDDDEKAALIEKDPRYGRIICRCENITEGEIVDAIHRKAGARTVDGVKRRARPGSGRCQGGFCMPRVMEILARELDNDILDVVKDGKDSKILTGVTKGGK